MKKPPGGAAIPFFRGNITMRFHQKPKPRFSGNAPQRQLRALANELHGEIAGPSWIIAPAPGAPCTDRSLQVSLSHSAPDGFCIVSRSVSRIEARAHVLAAIQRLRSIKADVPDLFGRSAQ
jgi:hypothetical protein